MEIVLRISTTFLSVDRRYVHDHKHHREDEHETKKTLFLTLCGKTKNIDIINTVSKTSDTLCANKKTKTFKKTVWDRSQDEIIKTAPRATGG